MRWPDDHHSPSIFSFNFRVTSTVVASRSRFRGTGTTRISSGGLRIREAQGLDHWMGWAGARRMPGLGMALEDFAITMHAPKRLARS